MTHATHSEIDRIVRYFESLQAADLWRLGDVYAEDALFKDPFNEVSGLDAIRAVYAHMFDALEEPRFVITGRWLGERDAVLRWRFEAKGLRGQRLRAIAFTGLTLMEFDASGRISVHRDYWDAAEEVYEKVPLLGALLRLLKRRMRAPHAEPVAIGSV